MSSTHFPEWPARGDSGIIPPQMAASDGELRQIAHRLGLLRSALELSQIAMATRIGAGVTAQKWNNYERARDRIPVDTATRLCVVSGASLDYIYRGLLGSLPAELAKKIETIESPPKRIRRA